MLLLLERLSLRFWYVVNPENCQYQFNSLYTTIVLSILATAVSFVKR